MPKNKTEQNIKWKVKIYEHFRGFYNIDDRSIDF